MSPWGRRCASRPGRSPSARLKFLKSETAERSHISALVQRYAIAYPLARFKLTFDNRATLQSSGSGDMREVLVAVYGIEVARQLIEVNSEYTKSQILADPRSGAKGTGPKPQQEEEDEADDLALRERRP